jgi:hypothetical protein
MCLIVAIISLSNADNASDLLRIVVALTLLVFVSLDSSPYGQSKKTTNPPVTYNRVFNILAWSTFLLFSDDFINPIILFLLPFFMIDTALLPKRQFWKSCLISLIIYIYLLVFYWQLNSPIPDNHFDIELQNISFIYTLYISAFISVYFAGVAAGAAELRVILLAMRCYDYILQIRALYQGPCIRTETLNKLKLRLTQKSEHRLCLGFVLDN